MFRVFKLYLKAKIFLYGLKLLITTNTLVSSHVSMVFSSTAQVVFEYLPLKQEITAFG